nr:importin-5-like isoform X2 [Tanacetum cinerariifolium]
SDLLMCRFYDCFQIYGPLLDENQVKSILDEIKQVITACSIRKGEQAERTTAEDFDAEEGELLKEENEQVEEVFDQVCSSNRSPLNKEIKIDALHVFLTEAIKLVALALSHALEANLQSHIWH